MITRYAMRWATDEDEFVYVSPVESDKGNWVKYDDYARLQTEVDHLMVFCNCTLIPNKELQTENASLKAEVERLTENTDKLCKHGDLEIERLKSEVERLTKDSEYERKYREVLAVLKQHNL